MSQRRLDPPHAIVSEFSSLLDEMKALYRRFYNLVSPMGDQVRAGKFSQQDLVDLGFLCRETKDHMDNWRKDAKAQEEAIGTKISITVTEKSLSNPNVETTIYGTLAYGRVDVDVIPQIPNPGTPEWNAYMESMGVSEEARQSGLVKPDWEKCAKEINRLKEDGKPLPPGVTRTYPHYFTIFTRKRGTT